MRIVIVATYYNRLPQLINTVHSLNQYRRDDFMFVVVDDKSDTEIPRLDTNFNMVVIRNSNKVGYNSCIPFNMGFGFALSQQPDIIILQNAECYHYGDIIGYAEQNLTDDNYIAFPCYSLSKDDKLPPEWLNNRTASFDGDSAWYNHPIYRPVGYHFCAAITASNLRKINGFDERFKDGKDYEDNYLLHQIKSLGLRVNIPEEPYVFHQWHYSSPRAGGSNEQLYKQLIQTEGYRAQHLITKDL